MVLVRTNATDLLQVGLDEVLFEKYRELKPVYAQIFDIRSSDRQFEKTSGFSGFGSMVNKPEGAVITYDDPLTSLIGGLKPLLINGENLRFN